MSVPPSSEFPLIIALPPIRPARHRVGDVPFDRFPTASATPTGPTWLQYRPASDLDGPTLFRMFHQAHAHEFADVADSCAREGLLSVRYVQERVHLHADFPDAIDVLAERDGTACARVVSVQRQGVIHVLGLFVMQEFRGHGIGRLSLQRLCGIAQAHGCGLALRPDAVGPDSVAFAEHVGFTVAAGDDRLLVTAA